MNKFIALFQYIVYGSDAAYDRLMGKGSSPRSRPRIDPVSVVKQIHTRFPVDMAILAKKDTTMANIVEKNGRFALVNRQGLEVANYSRRRDAVRGAARAGLVLA